MVVPLDRSAKGLRWPKSFLSGVSAAMVVFFGASPVPLNWRAISRLSLWDFWRLSAKSPPNSDEGLDGPPASRVNSRFLLAPSGRVSE